MVKSTEIDFIIQTVLESRHLINRDFNFTNLELPDLRQVCWKNRASKRDVCTYTASEKRRFLRQNWPNVGVINIYE